MLNCEPPQLIDMGVPARFISLRHSSLPSPKPRFASSIRGPLYEGRCANHQPRQVQSPGIRIPQLLIVLGRTWIQNGVKPDVAARIRCVYERSHLVGIPVVSQGAPQFDTHEESGLVTHGGST